MNEEIARYFGVCGFEPDDLIGIGTQAPGSPPRFRQYKVSDAPRQLSSRPQNTNVWINACPMREWPPVIPGEQPTRGTATDVTRVTALWADLDVDSGKKSLPSFDAAWSVIHGVSELIGARPVVVVMSGHGLQPRWRLDEPWENDHPTVAEELEEFGRLVQLVAERHGGSVDNVFDLPRILRAPGTVNNKDPENPITVTLQFPAANQGDVVELHNLRDAFADYLPAKTVIQPSTALKSTSVGLARGSKWLQGALTGIAADLAVAKTWAPGQTDDRGRGWEKLTADSAKRLAELAKAEFTPLTEDEAHAFLLENAPQGDGWGFAEIERKWTREWANAEPAEPPVERKVQHDDPLEDGYVPLSELPVGGPSVREGADGDAGRTGSFLALTDKGYAARLAQRYGEILRYSPKLDTWLRYTDGRWVEDKLGGQWAAHELTNDLYALEGGQYDDENEYSIGNRVTTERREFARWVKGQEATSRVKAASDMLKASGVLNVELSAFDSNIKILNAANCAVDIKEAKMLNHSPSLMMRRKTPVVYDPAAQCPSWAAFLQQAQPDPEVRAFVQRIVGYSLTGATSEQVIFLHRGPTRSGKSVFLRVLSAVLGDYARPMPESLLLNKNTEAHPTGIAGLEGCRVVYTDETAQGARWDEAVLKRLTGETPITARGMHQDFRDFRLAAKVHIVTNYPPHLSSDEATHRRLVVVPWDHTVPLGEVDQNLAERIVAEELPGVLAWAVRGAQEWNRRGLSAPEDANIAKAKYIQEEDEFGEWLQENTVDTGVDGFITPTKLLYGDYRSWAQSRGSNPMQMTTFGKELERRKKLQGRSAKARGWRMALQQAIDVTDPLESRP